MPDFNVVVSTDDISNSIRVRQVSGMFDVPISEKQTLSWDCHLPIEERDWNVGLIAGPSGSGKTVIASRLWGEKINHRFFWAEKSVIDCFSPDKKIEEISRICQAVGFNTIPAWMRPFRVLSNGEQFRVAVARAMLEMDDPIVIDEFTSVVDRQVAKITSHAVQKFVRKFKRRFVGISCHYDIIDWLQPDWLYEPATNTFQWRLLRRRPEINCTVSKVPHSAWKMFSKFHYLTAALHHSATCFALWFDERLASFAGVIIRPHPRVKDIMGLSRLVTLPDYQGLGLAFVLSDALGAAYKTIGKRFHTYPAHPALIRGFQQSQNYTMIKHPGKILSPSRNMNYSREYRPNAMFQYIGPAMADRNEAMSFLKGSEN